MALKHNAQLVLSEVGGQSFSGAGKGGLVQQERAVATLKVSSLCLPATDVPHSASKLSLHALMTH